MAKTVIRLGASVRVGEKGISDIYFRKAQTPDFKVAAQYNMEYCCVMTGELRNSLPAISIRTARENSDG
jgi:hypothetical protein